MSLHSLQRTQVLPVTVEEAWNFFTSPLNLSLITPPSMNFKILSSFNPGDKIFEGMLIDYYVSPLLHIPLRWQTEITKVGDLANSLLVQKKVEQIFSFREKKLIELFS